MTPMNIPVSNPVSEKSTSVTLCGPVYTLIGFSGVPITSILSESSFQPGAYIRTLIRSVHPSPSYLSLQSCRVNASFVQNFIMIPVVFFTIVKPVSADADCDSVGAIATAPIINIAATVAPARIVLSCRPAIRHMTNLPIKNKARI